MMHDRVSAWLDHLGLGIYRESFQHNAIAWDILPELNEGDLESLGVLLGHRKTLLRAIAQLSPSAEARGLGPQPPAASRKKRPSPPNRNQPSRRKRTACFGDLVDPPDLSGGGTLKASRVGCG